MNNHFKINRDFLDKIEEVFSRLPKELPPCSINTTNGCATCQICVNISDFENNIARCNRCSIELSVSEITNGYKHCTPCLEIIHYEKVQEYIRNLSKTHDTTPEREYILNNIVDIEKQIT
jgi:hypothetical protein